MADAIKLKDETKYLAVTAITKRGFNRCGYHFSRDPQLVSIEDLAAYDEKRGAKVGAAAAKLLNETGMLIVKQLKSTPGKAAAREIESESKTEAAKAVRKKVSDKRADIIEKAKAADAAAAAEDTKPRKRKARGIFGGSDD